MTVAFGDYPKWKLAFDSESCYGSILGDLRTALLTTYDPPDPQFLVEDLLPGWLKLSREYSEIGPEREPFFAELQLRLRALRGRFAIFATPRMEDERPHWIWRYIHRCWVGRREKAVQHAKLWLLHRGPADKGEPETLEIVVGSSNLSRSALRDQIQAGWRAIVPLQENPRDSRLASWGILWSFLIELGCSSGEVGRNAVNYWVKQVLPRAECPGDVCFVASAPGRYSARDLKHAITAWGLAGLRRLGHRSQTRRIEILVPTVGSFSPDTLDAWARGAGARVERLTLAWIAKTRPPHEWAPYWQMPAKTARTLRRSGIALREVPQPDTGGEPFHQQKDVNDKRWIHGKRYWIRDGRRSQLLVTSANWSTAAWGMSWRKGGLFIENFELGVAFPSNRRCIDTLHTLTEDLHTAGTGDREPEPVLAWAEATWDGFTLRVAARVGGKEASLDPMIGVDVYGQPPQPVRVAWNGQRGGKQEASKSWNAARGCPRAVQLHALTKMGRLPVAVPVADMRESDSLPEDWLEDVDLECQEELELRLLEERYGGPMFEAARPVPGGAEEQEDPKSTTENGDIIAEHGYGVAAIEEARRKLTIVDVWAKSLASLPASDGGGQRTILLDGKRLAQLWGREAKRALDQKKLALKVAAAELSRRVEVEG
jgi:hypothetical protein